MKLVIVIAGNGRSPITSAAVRLLGSDQRVEIKSMLERPLVPSDLVDVDLLLSAGHTHYIGREVREAPRLGTVGLHPSLLPRYRGSHPLWWALRNGESETGVTVYRLGAGFDEGPVLDQRRVAILPGDTWGSLYRRALAEVGPLLSRLLDELIATDAIPAGIAQDERLASTFRAPHPFEMHAWRAWLRFRHILAVFGRG